MKKVAEVSGICTHGHRTAVAASIGAAYLVKLALDDAEPGSMIPKLLAFTSGTSREFDRAISKVEECLGSDDEEKALKSLGEGWIGEEAVALALYCFLRYPNDPHSPIQAFSHSSSLSGANTSGDSDSIASMAGGISGARLGLDAIPKDWYKRIEKTDYLNDLSLRLAEKKASLWT